ncbi:serine/threonine-protein kinase [Tuwongella immobilis]|uniref:Protein kinase domain-containing protein n=1 Tax=Tuwongella immobilis TaxID=692036 RepID=A0A6C2YXB1_9BACT
MPAPATLDDLVTLIRKSGMLDDSRLEAYLTHLQQHHALPEEPKRLAAMMVRDGLLTFFQADQFMLGKWRGFTMGKYKLLERIGVGGMGQVFLCEHLYMRRRVAIKILPPAKAEEPAALGRFYREARASGSMDHPNIVRTHDIDQDGQFHFLVMEYVDGASTLELVKRFGPMDVARAANIIHQAAIALEHAHRSGLVHRDIKPGNLMVDRDGIVKLLDLGLARFYHDNQDMLTLKYDENNVLGTADYVAPEQTVNSHTVDIRADIYGLGATFYFLLAGHPPFPEGTVSQKLVAQQTREPKPIREIRPDVPEGLALTLAKMMAKDLRYRYQSPEDVITALAPWTQTPVPPPRPEEMPQLCLAAQGSDPEPQRPAAMAGARSMGSLAEMSAPRSGGVPSSGSSSPFLRSTGSSAVPITANQPNGSTARMGKTGSGSETRPMSGAMDQTPGGTDRHSTIPPLTSMPPMAPMASGVAPTAPQLPQQELGTGKKLVGLLFLAAFVGSGLALFVWWKFLRT